MIYADGRVELNRILPNVIVHIRRRIRLHFFFFFVLIVSHQCCYSIFSFFFVPFICYLLYRILGMVLSHRRPALMVLTFPAAYHNRNVIFFNL